LPLPPLPAGSFLLLLRFTGPCACLDLHQPHFGPFYPSYTVLLLRNPKEGKRSGRQKPVASSLLKSGP
ncbi:MAG: hypothetical protein ABIK79_06950, partial [Chloroflexota bacterium]